MNRARVLALLSILIAIALVIWIARNTYWAETSVPQPLRGEAATNPFYAVERFARALGASTERPRDLQSLSRSNVLLLTNWNWSLISTRREAIERWVENGGRLVLDGRLVETDTNLSEWAGLSRIRVEEGGEFVELANDDPVNERNDGCGRVTVGFDDGASAERDEYRLCTVPILRALESEDEPQWSLEDPEGIQAARVAVGAGSVTWLTAAPFLNRHLMDVDHGLLFVAATQLRAGDRIMLMSDEGQLSLLALIWKHGAPVVVLLLLWLAAALWRNGARFGPPAPSVVSVRRSLAEQIKGTSEFTRRFGGGRALHAAAVRALNETASRRLPRYHFMTSEQRFQTLAQLTALDAERLAETVNYSGPRGQHELKKALELIEQARRRLETNPHSSAISSARGEVHGS